MFFTLTSCRPTFSRYHRRITAAAVLLAVGLCDAGRAGIRAGFAEKDITPQIGMERPGGYGKAYHKAIHDPCKVRAAVFDDGEQCIALVGIDALVIHRPQVLEVRRRIEQRTEIPGEAILIGASHSHSSGPTGMILPGQYDHAAPMIQDLAYNQSSMADPGYLKQVTTALTEAVVDAYAGRTDVRCGFGSGKEPTVAFNRRFRMNSGLTFTHPRQGNPNIVEVAGPTDPEVGVIAAWDRSTNDMLGCVVNFACHATTNPPGASANYICYLEQAIRGMFGQNVVVVFLNGASGDVTQVDNLSRLQRRSGEASARFVGGRVGAEAVKIVLGMTPGEDVPLDANADVFDVARRAPRPQRVEQARQLIKQQNRRSPDWVWAKETLLLDALLASEPVVQVEVQAVQVGPAVFVTTPAEYFCQYGLEIKGQSKFPFTYPVSLANGCVGYVPTPEAFGEEGGGYETRLTSYSNLQITAGNRMRDKGLELINGMEPGPVFNRPPAPPFRGHPWSYGNVPPQRD